MIPDAISWGTGGLAVSPQAELPAPMLHCGLCPCSHHQRIKEGSSHPTGLRNNATLQGSDQHHLPSPSPPPPCSRRSGSPWVISVGFGSSRCRAGGAADGAGPLGSPPHHIRVAE